MADSDKEASHPIERQNPPADNTIEDGDAHFEQERKIKGFKWCLVVVSLFSGTTLYALDNTIVADLQPQIIDAFGSSALPKLPWVSVGTPLGCMATNFFWGKIFGQFNGKWTYILTVVLFEIGSAMCAAAPTIDVLIAGRVLAGVGGVGLYLGFMTLLGVNTTRHERPTYVGFSGIAWGIGTVSGPIVGGAFAVSSVGWRWAFYINLLFFAIQLPIAVFLIPSFDPRPGVPYKARFAQIDYVGTVLVMGASVSFVLAVNCGGQIYPWNSGQIIASFVVSGVLWIAFAIQQSRCLFTTLQNRIFPCQFVTRPIFINIFCQAASTTSISFVATYFVPLFFQYTRNDSPIEAGVRLLPLVCFTVLGTLSSGALMSRWGYYMPWYMGGSILALIGSALMYTVDLPTPAANIYGYTILIGLGTGLYYMTNFSVAQAKARPSEIPDASGFVSFGQLSASAIALAIANSVFLNDATSGVLAAIPGSTSAQVQQAISGGERGSFANSLPPETRTAVLEAITKAVGKVYILAITAAAFTTVLSCFLPLEKLFVAAPRNDDEERAEECGVSDAGKSSASPPKEEKEGL